MQFIRGFMLFGLALVAVVTAACDKGDRLPETGATLEGTVTFKDQKVPYALVVAAGGKGGTGSASAEIGEDGRYVLTNVPLGDVKLAVITEAVKMKVQMAGGRYAGPEGKSKGKKVPFLDVPVKYADPEKSGITTTINKGKNEYNIVLK